MTTHLRGHMICCDRCGKEKQLPVSFVYQCLFVNRFTREHKTCRPPLAECAWIHGKEKPGC